MATLAFTSTQAPSKVDISAQNDEQQQPGMADGNPFRSVPFVRQKYLQAQLQKVDVLGNVEIEVSSPPSSLQVYMRYEI